MITKDLGVVTAYAYAVLGGYTGTEEEFTELLGNIATDLEEIENLSVTATTLPEGSSATASYSDGVLTLGIPRGNTGATGNGISSVVLNADYTLTINYTNGQSVTTTSIRGAQGDTGNGIASIELTSTSGSVKTYTVTYTDGDTFDFDVTDGEVTNASLEATLEDYAKTDGYYQDMTVGDAEQLVSTIYEEDSTPYLFRTSGGSIDIGDREYDEIVGGTVAWNQLCGQNARSVAGYGVSYDSTTKKYTISGTVTFANLLWIDNFPTINGHKYLASCSDATIKMYLFSGANLFYGGTIVSGNGGTGYIGISTQEERTFNNTFQIYAVDLTLMFGSTIANYIYALEQGNAGAGVAFFRKLFPKPYYAYDAGSLKSVSGLKSHDMVGFNAWDGTYEANKWLSDYATGEVTAQSGYNLTDYIQIVPNTTYYKANNGSARVLFYDADKNVIPQTSWTQYIPYSSECTFTSPQNAHYMRFTITPAKLSAFCLNLHWDGERDGEYEEYVKHSYALDDSLTLRGIPKLDVNNKLYYDGDTYESDGTVTRKYGIVDLGSLTWTYKAGDGEGKNTYFRTEINGMYSASSETSYANIISSKYRTGPDYYVRHGSVSAHDKMIGALGNSLNIADSSYSDAATFKTAMDGVMLVYALATPTTESADAYTNPQIVDDFGTEEYVIDSSVTVPIPVGHNTKYTPNLRAKLEMLPNSPDSDGDYIVRHTSGESAFVLLEKELPTLPSEDGTYVLKCTVSSGTAALTWESEE